MINAAVIQLVSGQDTAANMARVEYWLRKAAAAGANWVVLPETFYCFGRKDQRVLAQQFLQAGGPLRSQLANLARELNISLFAGSLPLAEGCQQADKVRASCLVYSEQGREIARYDKIHLFDVDVGDAHGRYRESDTYEAGEQPVTVQMGDKTVGLSICYDLRFAELYRTLSASGAQAVIVPSAFTYTTGEAHWHVLLRARAIENQMFVLAPNQGGQHDANRRTYGHSMIIDPWGKVLAEVKDEGEGMAMAALDFAYLEDVRRKMPVAAHRKLP